MAMKKMTVALILSVVVSLAAGRPAAGEQADAGKPRTEFKGPVKVFILAGQSNMEGHGGIRTINELGAHPTLGNLLKKIKKDDGSFVVRDDVFVSYLRGADKVKRPLTVGQGINQDYIGPELMFGIDMGDYYKEPVLLIKTCWGGHTLFGHFRSPSAGKPAYDTGDWPKPENVGESYREMVKEVRECLANLDTDFPQLKGMKTEISGFVWFQGWNDMCSGKKEVFDEYCSNFVHLVQDLRKEFNVPNMPAVVGELGVGGENVDKNNLDFRAAQAKLATCPELKGTVGYVRTAPFWYPALDELPGKLDTEERRVRKAAGEKVKEQMKDKPESKDSKKMEQLVQEAGDKALEVDVDYQKVKKEHDGVISHWGCHYQGSARVYALVGYGLAEAMKPLLKKE
jgi:alpha-galactosidase